MARFCINSSINISTPTVFRLFDHYKDPHRVAMATYQAPSAKGALDITKTVICYIQEFCGPILLITQLVI